MKSRPIEISHILSIYAFDILSWKVFQHTIEEIEDTFLSSKDPKDVKLREELSKNLPIKQEDPIL